MAYPIKRRRFIAGLVLPPLLAALPATARGLGFYVAGVRYQGIEAGPEAGEAVRIVRDRFADEPCFRVLVGDRQIGFVPRATVPVLGRAQELHGTLAQVDADAVPWRQYWVESVRRIRA